MMAHEGTKSAKTHEGASCVPGLALEFSYRLDLVVDDLVVVELKSVERLEPIHHLQLLTYLRLSGRWMGLLLDFNTDRMKHGVRRLLNG